MKVLFINPWLKSLFGDSNQVPGHPHLGLAYLIAVCKREGIECAVFDQGIENDDEILFQRIGDFGPDLLAMTSFSYCYDYAEDLIGKIKGRVKIPLIVGGPHVSATKSQILEKTSADFAMKGEAETSFLKFLDAFRGNRDYDCVPNLLWRKENGDIIENEDERLIQDLDSLPFPDYDAFGFQRYNYFVSKALPIITSRGCPYGCSYCSVRLSMGRGFRPHSPERVVEEMEHFIKKYGIEKFEINDDCFSLDIERAERICDLIMERGLDIKYELYNGIRADRVTERLLKKMKDSGCIFVSYGCESGSQEIIDRMGKSLKLEDVRRAVELTNKIGIRNSVNFIFGHIGETRETAMQTLKFAKSLPANFVNMYNIVPYPGTVLYDWVEKNADWKMPAEEYLGKVGSRDLEPVFSTEDFSREERKKVLEKGFALYERSVLRFRLGKVLGYLAYLASRNKKLFEIGRKFALSSKAGFWIYEKLSTKSRKN